MFDVERHNREAWDRQVREGNRWTVPVAPDQVQRAREGVVEVVLTPARLVPSDWLGEIAGRDILCLASGGGQQAPLFAAAGGRVTELDNSPAQLEQDRWVAEREGLMILLELGLMDDLSRFSDESFDLIFHPVSNVFAPTVLPVWREAFRVLRGGGVLLAGFENPWFHMLDMEKYDRGELEIRHAMPYSDFTSLTEAELAARIESGEPLEFGHRLEDQIGGQIDAGFAITGFYEDSNPAELAGRYAPMCIATRARKPEMGGRT